jgi:hypothetical protein
MDVACSTLGGEEECRVLWENLKERDHWEDRLILKLILEK